MTMKNDLAKDILRMSYGTMMDFCSDLSGMVEPDSGRDPPRTTEEFASLLYDWAETQK